MNSVLTAKHWQIFLTLLFGVLLTNFTVTGQPLITTVLAVIGYFILFSWPLVLGLELYKYLPVRVELGNTLFLINAVIILLLVTAGAIILDGQNYEFSGLSALPLFYIFFAYFHLHYFPGKVLKIIELGKEASFADYIGYGVLIFFWPVGIWFLQPKVNKAIVEQLALEEKKYNNRPPTTE